MNAIIRVTPVILRKLFKYYRLTDPAPTNTYTIRFSSGVFGLYSLVPEAVHSETIRYYRQYITHLSDLSK